MSYYNLEQTLEVFRKDLPETLLPFGLPQLADLCRRGEVTTVFPYDKYINEGLANERELPTYVKELTRAFNGYLTLPALTNLISELIETVNTSTAYVYEEIGKKNKGIFVSLENSGYDRFEDNGGHDSYCSGDTQYIGINNLLFPIEQVKAYISSNRPDYMNEPILPATLGNFGNPILTPCEPKTDKELVIELEKELAAVKAELKEQTDALANDKDLSTRSQNLAAKIILALLDIAELDRNSLPYQYDDLSSNNCIIHDQIKANGMKVGQQKIGHWLDLAINQTKDK
ncbi:hypothetical protein MT378_02030 [Psychrobacter sp. 16-Bac2893]